MYSRRIKLNKKKTKPASRLKPSAPGSNWGPRLAIIERERAIATGGIEDDEEEEEEIYQIQQELVHSANKKLAGGGGGNGIYQTKRPSSQYYGTRHEPTSSTTAVDPVLRLGRSSSPNYFYYNYSRRTAPDASAAHRKSSCPEPTFQQREQRMANGKTSSHSHPSQQQQQQQQQQQHLRRASYVLGSSSGYCSGSVTTLSTCANNNNSHEDNNNSNLRKPLTLIIPPHDGHGHGHPRLHNNNNALDFSVNSHHHPHNNNGSNGMILMKRASTNNFHARRNNGDHDHRHQDDEGNVFETEEQSLEESFPSSSAYQSSGDELEGSSSAHHVKHERQSKRPFQNPMAHMNNKKSVGGGNGGILQISSKKEVVQVHAAPKLSPETDDMGTATEPETLEMGAGSNDDESDQRRNGGDKVGSTISALHKGITMVYVPMAESSSGGGREEDSAEDMPQLGHHHHPHQQVSDNDCSSTSSSYRAGAESQEPQDSLMSSNFILKKKEGLPGEEERGGRSVAGASAGVMMDSLLDSYESMLFKPKPGEAAVQKYEEKCQQDGVQKGIRKRPEQPPPLPPPAGGSGSGQQNTKQKSLRFALDNLETVLNPCSLKTPEPCYSGSEDSSPENRVKNNSHGHHHVPPAPMKKVLKKVTLSLPGEDAVSSRNHELLLNYEELNTCSSEILSCGHVRSDDHYSTLSSMTSSAQEISDLDEVINGCSGSGHDNGRVGVSHSNSSAGESDAGSASGGAADVVVRGKSEPPLQREPRSVLQQLRDLSRLIRGSSPTKPTPAAAQPTHSKKEVPAQSNNNKNSFYLHSGANNGNSSNDTEVAKRKTSDATDNSADSGKGSGSSTSQASASSSGQEGSSASSAEPSPNNIIRGGPANSNNGNVMIAVKGKSAKVPGGILNSKKLEQSNGRKLKIATIRGRGGGTGSRHYCPTDDEHQHGGGGCSGGGDDSCSHRSSVCSCQDCCDYRSDCNECCALYSKPPNSQELCSGNDTAGIYGNAGRKVKQQAHPTQNLPPPPPPPSQQRAPKQSVSKVLVRRTSSRIRAAAARRTASLRRARAEAKQRERKPVILDYCDCSNCGEMEGPCGDHPHDDEEDDDDEFDEVDEEIEGPGGRYCSERNCGRPPSRRYKQHDEDTLIVPINQNKLPSNNKHHSKSSGKKSGVESDSRKISNSSYSSGVSSSSACSAKLSSRIAALRSSSAQQGAPHPPASHHKKQKHQQQQPSQLLRQSDAASNGAALANNPVSVMVPHGGSVSNLFTIDEANEDSVYGEPAATAAANGSGPVIIGKGQRNNNNNNNSNGSSTTGSASSSSSFGGGGGGGPRVDFQLHEHQDDLVSTTMNDGGNKVRRMSSHSHHSHPKCWLAPDATLGWSDLESLYSQNMKVEGGGGGGGRQGGSKRASSKKGHPLPVALRDECPTCWKELSEMKKNCPDPNRTVDRTKRMFIWLNRRHKEFHAPWWEAKKQASMRWLVTKSFAQAVPKDKIPDPFKESKKGKPTKYSLRDEIVKGLVSGRLYCMALDSLYRSQQNNYHLSQNLTHWEIIKILSRRGIYIAQPSDMKLTETTLRQKKPIRTAAHIALIEAMMGLYAKEILGRDRIAQTLTSFGRAIEPDTNSPERLVISWINTAVCTLKSYILTNPPQHLPASKVTRWFNLPDVGEIRDLCDGVGICALLALYCSNDLKVEEISVPEPGDTLTIYDSITNHSLVQKLCEDLFPEPIYHLCVTDFLYIHGCMKQNILCFLVDLFVHLEIHPIHRVNRLTHVPIRVQL